MTMEICCEPFDHIVIDDFFDVEIALELEREFPEFDDSVWYRYDNPLEIKRACNNWNVFPAMTYQQFTQLTSEKYASGLGELLDIKALKPDVGLNGGGWHAHKAGGYSNTHLDYSLHPKLGWRRKLNLIVYLNSSWKSEWGGQLGLWSGDELAPDKLVKQIDPLFNRAVIFDTTQNSWHGLPEPIRCPEDQVRKSIAVYYLDTPLPETDRRSRALFAPRIEQIGNKEIEKLILQRSKAA